MDAVAALAELGRRAVAPFDRGRVLQDGVEIVAATLGVTHVTVLELAPEGGDVRLRAGVGWAEGAIGRTVDAMPGGYVAYTLAAAEPVVVADLAAETRFAASPVLLDIGIRSSLAVRIPGIGERPFGAVGVHATEPRQFSREDLTFVEGVATILASVIARHRQAVEINDEILQSLILAHYALEQGRPDAGALLDAAIERTRGLISGLLGPPLPGDLRRGAPAGPPPPA